MAHGTYVDDALAVVYGVYDAVVADPQPPKVALAAQLSTTGRPGRVRQRLDSRQDPLDDIFR
jgi:hypothetical protein